MGVINLTPNSFSDGNRHITAQNLSHFLIENDQENLIYDFGMESTAPMNQAIDFETEKTRFNQFVKDIESFLKDKKSPFKMVSIDTYRPQFFKYTYEVFKKIDPTLQLIFNDVSGVIDQELIEVLNECPDSFYIFTHNRINQRDETLKHMQFVLENNQVIEEVIARFDVVYKKFMGHNLEKRLILDPGFGFAKTYAENWILIKNFSHFESLYFRYNLADVPLVIGLSKKSFLRKVFDGLPHAMESSEFLHFEILKSLIKDSRLKLIFRVHDFKLPINAQKILNFFQSP